MSFKRLVFGFLIAITIAALGVVFNTSTVLKSQANIQGLTQEIYPYVEKLNELDMLVTKSRMLITNWVYLPYSEADKQQLVALHEERYPKLKQELNAALSSSFRKSDKQALDQIFQEFESLILLEQEIMSSLPDAASYEDALTVFDAEELIETEVLPQTNQLLTQVDQLLVANKRLAEQKKQAMLESLDLLKLVVIGFGVAIMLVMLFSYLYIQNKIAKPVRKIRDYILELSVGRQPKVTTQNGESVIGEMQEAVLKLSENFASTAHFAREIGEGHYEASYQKLSEEDMLGNALLNMRTKLADYAHSMEEKVAERTKDLEEKQRELQTLNQELSASEEEIRQNSEELMAVNEHLKDTSAKLEEAFNKEQETTQKLSSTLDELKETQAQLVQSEKMSSLGQLTAGVAHEINNPINFVYAGAHTLKGLIDDLSSLIQEYDSLNAELPTEELLSKLAAIDKRKQAIYFDEMEVDLKDLIKDILHGAERTQAIVKSLRTFTRLDENEIKQTNLHDNIDSTLVILNTKLKDKVVVKKEYDEFLPSIECLAGPINQVFMNVISNAAEAVEEGGEVTIRTQHLSDQEKVAIEISDNGTGMTQETKDKLFDPFYTTKDVGDGTGLGLSIVHGIIEKHHGTIAVTSEVGEGSTFRIELPIRQN